MLTQTVTPYWSMKISLICLVSSVYLTIVICFINTLFFMNLEWLRYTSICFISSSRSSVLRAPFDFNIWISSSKSRRPRSMEDIFESWKKLEETDKDRQLDDLLTYHWSKKKEIIVGHVPALEIYSWSSYRNQSTPLYIASYQVLKYSFSNFIYLSRKARVQYWKKTWLGARRQYRWIKECEKKIAL